MNGYQLSRRAAEAEVRNLASRGLPIEAKAIMSLTAPIPPGGQDGANLRDNTITTERYSDTAASVRGDATGLTATWACVSFWAGNIASLPVSIQRKGPGGVSIDDTSHPLYWLLHDSPNYDQSAFDFWEYMVASIELRGNAYAEIERRFDGVITSLTPIPPDAMSQPTRLPSGDIEYKWIDASGQRRALQPDVLHIRGFGGTPLGGVSPLSACRKAFESAVATDRAAATVFANGVRPSGVMSTEKVLTGDQRPTLERLLQEKFVGALNAGRPMLLDNGVKWEQLSIDPHDAEMLESRRFGVEEICRVFEVDPHLVGQTQGNTALGSSISEQTRSVMTFKMRKRLKRLEGALSKQLLTRADRAAGISIKFNVEAFLRADSAGRAEYYDIMQQFMTKNEIRALEGLPPVEGGDVLMAQMQDVPLSKAIRGTGPTQ
jgi:HK97 family phage portal protein